MLAHPKVMTVDSARTQGFLHIPAGQTVASSQTTSAVITAKTAIKTMLLVRRETVSAPKVMDATKMPTTMREKISRGVFNSSPP